jgi:hypothetical protein
MEHITKVTDIYGQDEKHLKHWLSSGESFEFRPPRIGEELLEVNRTRQGGQAIKRKTAKSDFFFPRLVIVSRKLKQWIFTERIPQPPNVSDGDWIKTGELIVRSQGWAYSRPVTTTVLDLVQQEVSQKSERTS